MGIKARVLASIIVFTMLLVFSVGRSAYAGVAVPGLGDNFHVPEFIDPQCTAPDFDLAINRPIADAIMCCESVKEQCIIFEGKEGVEGIRDCVLREGGYVDCIFCAVDELCIRADCAR